MESVLMTTPPVFCASASASADLPLAVGPAISTALFPNSEFACMSLVATLICNPANPALDSTIVDGALAGEIEFEPALRERVALLKNMPLSVVDEVLKQRITPTPGGRQLVMTMRANGAYTCLISGGFTLFTGAVAAMIGFQENRANELGVRDGKLSGEVAEPILGRAAKLATLIELRESFDLDEIDTLVAGDGANDLGMIQAAGLAAAYHAKPAVAAAAAARSDYGDPTAAVDRHGHRRDEFAD